MGKTGKKRIVKREEPTDLLIRLCRSPWYVNFERSVEEESGRAACGREAWISGI